MQAAASKVEQLLDKLTETLTGDKERMNLFNLYRQAMNLEVDFFGAQSLGNVHLPYFKCQVAPETRLLLVSDFDSTCTISDSCPVLADLTVQIAGKARDSHGASLLRKKWDDLVMRYMDDYEELLSRCLSNLHHGKDTALSKHCIYYENQMFVDSLCNIARVESGYDHYEPFSRLLIE